MAAPPVQTQGVIQLCIGAIVGKSGKLGTRFLSFFQEKNTQNVHNFENFGKVLNIWKYSPTLGKVLVRPKNKSSLNLSLKNSEKYSGNSEKYY